MPSLIQKLDALAHLTPDQIQARVSTRWNLPGSMTQDFYDKHRDDFIILFEKDAYGPGRHFTSTRNDYRVRGWAFDQWRNPNALGQYHYILEEDYDDGSEPH